MTRPTRRIASLAPLGLLAAALTVATGSAGADEGEVRYRRATVAEVQGTVITRGDVQRYLEIVSQGQFRALRVMGTPEAQAEIQARLREALDELVDRELYLAEARRLGISLSAEEEREVQRVIGERTEREGLEAALASIGMTLRAYEQTLRESFLVRKLIRQSVGADIFIPPHLIREFYALHENDYVIPGTREITLYRFPFPEREVPLAQFQEQMEEFRRQVTDVCARAQRGEDVAAVAAELGLRVVSASYAGDAQIGSIREACVEPALTLNQGEVAGPIEVPRSGLYVVRADRVVHATVRPLGDVSDDIRLRLRDLRFASEVRRYTDGLRQRAFVRSWPDRLWSGG